MGTSSLNSESLFQLLAGPMTTRHPTFPSLSVFLHYAFQIKRHRMQNKKEKPRVDDKTNTVFYLCKPQIGQSKKR